MKAAQACLIPCRPTVIANIAGLMCRVTTLLLKRRSSSDASQYSCSPQKVWQQGASWLQIATPVWRSRLFAPCRSAPLSVMYLLAACIGMSRDIIASLG